MKLRWLLIRRTITAADVRAYRDAHNVSMADALGKLRCVVEPTLQAEDSDGNWCDIPLVIEEK